ncbi:uncharacterized protein TNCV_1233341 [Trichonephila clavipes]|nr:uncharacterized protein TNCV_1233341 [Trichonephila clavipes]
MNRIRQHVHLLHVLSAASPQQRNAILKSATNEQIKTLCEICQNVLAGNVRKQMSNDCVATREPFRQLADEVYPLGENGQNTGFPVSHKTSYQCPAVLLPPSLIIFQDVKPLKGERISEKTAMAGSDVVQSGRQFSMTFSNICGHISAITRRDICLPNGQAFVAYPHRPMTFT